ncbi:MAG: hypothetical protein ACJ79S_16775 [Gemmatimonadaceae bacterium]
MPHRRTSRRSTPPAPPSVADDLADALDRLLEEGIGSYDDASESGRRRMAELTAGFASAEALLARLRAGDRASSDAETTVPALASVVRYILHWAGEERVLDEPPETLAALRNARRALERASAASPARDGGAEARGAARRRGGAA